MLTLWGDRQRYCDGISRRGFLKIGALGVGGLTLTDVLRAEAATGKRNPHKAVILVYLPGGISHQDTFDLKMDAPSEVRGEFKPIDTNVSGIQISEHLPRLAKIMDKCAVIRSLVGARDEHANPLCVSGYTMGEAAVNHPSLGAICSRAWGPVDRTVPPFVDMIPKTQHKPYSIPAATGFLGRAYGAAKPDEQGMADMTLQGVTLQRLSDRRRMLQSVDSFRRLAQRDDVIQGSDSITQQAFDILTSSKFVEALDVSKEDEATRKLYGKGWKDGKVVAGDAVPCKSEQFLAARRLVEAGARCVTLGYGFWDTHGNNFTYLKEHLAHLDQAITALITDIHQRGLDKDVTVLMWGDFGRTPRINKDGGRDHWPAVNSALLAGGGMRTGQVLGSTTKDGGYADERPIHHRDVMATVLYNMGFDVRHDQVIDPVNRPVYLYPGHEPIPELAPRSAA